MRPTTSGWEIVWSEPIGSGMFSHASSRMAGGTNASRGTARRASSTRSSWMCRASVRIRRSAVAGMSLGDARAGGAHLRHGALGVPGLDVDAADAGRVDGHPEAAAQRVHDRVVDAVLRRQADDGEVVDALRAQQRVEVRPLKARVALVRRLLPRVDDLVDEGAVERRVQLGPLRALHAVHGPRTALLGERV